MRLVLMALCVLVGCPMGGLAQQANRPSSFNLVNKSVVISNDFCEVTKSCVQSPLPTMGLAMDSRGVEVPPVFKKFEFKALKDLQASPQHPSPEAMQDLAASAGARGVVDICNSCRCCIETDKAVTLNRPAAAFDSNEFLVFSK